MATEEQLAGGRYTLRGVIGKGAQGTTFDAVSARDGRSVAIKRFDVQKARAWKDVELAEREARVLSTLDHPLVPRYLEHFEEDGALYLVMEKVEGETLDALRKREGGLPEAEVRRFLADADRALTYLHGRASPIVHRDINPRNVVRRGDGSYVLVDFGAVSERIRRSEGGSTIVGTMGYMAPEQLQGRAMAATDVYCVGATAVAALTNAEPEALPHRGLRLDVGRALEGRASEALVRSLEQMLEPDPELRPKSLALALDGTRAEEALAPIAPAPVADRGAAAPFDEDALVKSIRGLLWALWGLSWAIVPAFIARAGARSDIVPVVMFSGLAAILVITWHKGALLRWVVRELRGARGTNPALPRAEGAARPRIEARPGGGARVSDSPLADPEAVTERHEDEQRGGTRHG